MKPSEMLKQAALAIRGLRAEKEELEQKFEIEKIAEKLVYQFIEVDELNGKEALEKLGELRQKSLGELQVIEKAMELTKTSSFRLGSLSAQFEGAHSNLDNLTAYLIDNI